MVNVIKFRCILNFLLLATLAVMDARVSGYKKKYRDNEAGLIKDNEASSSRETVCERLKCRKYNTKYVL
jgi:hypothetical protein